MSRLASTDDRIDTDSSLTRLRTHAQQGLIDRSRQRCVARGMAEHWAPSFDRAARGDLSDALWHNEALRRHASPVMETLHQQIVDSTSMVVLTDASGMIVHSLGDDDFLARAQRVALTPGVSWAESDKGTNAIGTALVEQRPTLVHADQHLLRANHFLTCSAAPIFDPRGGLAGILDVTGDEHGYHHHTMALVRMSATMIENKLVVDDPAASLRLHFHPQPEFIGTLAEGIVTFTLDGRFESANGVARRHFGLLPGSAERRGFAELFETRLAEVYDHARRADPRPVLFLRDRTPVFARVVLYDPPSRPAGVAGARPAGDRATAALPACLAAVARAGTAKAPQAVRPDGGALARLDTGDEALSEVIRKVGRILDRGVPILVLGETGSGKELLARAIHEDSARRSGPFVAVNCASIPESLIESELFGYEEGAFTGARRRGHVGRLQQAHRGTLFLDEIGDMPLSLQARLLRVLQDRAVVPLGACRATPFDAMLICATHRDLKSLMGAQLFRQDLYYRINGLAVRLPPLRARTDLDALLQRVLEAELPDRAVRIDPEVRAMFGRHPWPGNVRQLANLLRTACAMLGDGEVIGRAHLPDEFLEDLREPDTVWPAGAEGGPVDRLAAARLPPESGRLDDVTRAVIQASLERNRGNVSVTARELGISRNTIYRRLQAGGGPVD
jgi:transcriptional regulator of acetoin/glycerol metabolism